MAVDKFFGEQDERHNGKLHWPGLNGVPIRNSSDQLLLKNEDYKRLVLASDFHSKVFDLSNEEDREYYCWVMDRILAGMFSIIFCERFWDKQNNRVLIYLEWAQNYFELSNRPEMLEDNAMASSLFSVNPWSG